MKRIIMFVLLFAALKVAGQTTGYLRFDTVRIMKQNGTCELYIINKTKDSLGLLTNVGGGLTQFKRSRVLNDSVIVVGLDTLTIKGTGGGGGAPSGPAGGDLTGTYPNPTIAANAITTSKINNAAVTIAKLSATGTADNTTFLRGDGTWATPAGGSPGGNDQDVQYNNSSAFGGSSGRFLWNNTNKRVSIFGTSATDLTRQNDFSLKIIGSQMYLGDANSGNPTFIEFGNPHSANNVRMFCGWLGTREFNYGYNLDYRVTGQGQHQYHDTTEPIVYTFMDPLQEGLQVVPKGYSNIDYTTGLKQDVYSLYGKVIRRWDYIVGGDDKYYGSRLTLNELRVMDTSNMSKDMSGGYSGRFSTSGTVLRYGGTAGWNFADSVNIGIGGQIQTGYKLSINTNSSSNTTASTVYYNNGDNTSFNKIRYDKVLVNGSHNVGAGVKNPWIDISGGVAEEGWISTSSAPGSFSNYEKYFKLSDASGNFSEVARIKETGQLRLHKYGSGSFTGTPTYSLQVDASGNLIEGSLAGSSITSINSQTGSSQLISGGAGISINSSSDVHTVAINTNLDAQITDANNTGTSATDLYSKTIAANQLTLNGQSIHFEAAGVNNDATATVNLEALFAGNGIAGTGAVTISATGAWTITGTIIRATSTTARVYTVVTIDNNTQKVFLTTANLTGLDWTTTNVLKIRATAGGGGGGSNDITAQMWKVIFQP